MNVVLKPVEVRFETMNAATLDAVLQVEQQAYVHPWQRINFIDSLQAGYQAQLLLAQDTLLGYFVAMKGVDEVHLLNITVAPEYQRQGIGKRIMRALETLVPGTTIYCETGRQNFRFLLDRHFKKRPGLVVFRKTIKMKK